MATNSLCNGGMNDQADWLQYSCVVHSMQELYCMLPLLVCAQVYQVMVLLGSFCLQLQWQPKQALATLETLHY